MVIELKRESGLLFAVDTVDFEEIGEHVTGGTYILFNDGTFILLDQDYKTVKDFLNSCVIRLDVGIIPSGFTLMSKQRYEELKVRVKRVKGVKR